MKLRIPKKLSKIFSDESTISRYYGTRSVKIIDILDDIYQADSLYDLKSMQPTLEELKGDRAETFSLRISGNWRMIIEPDWDAENAENFLKDDGGINYSTVNCVLLIEIVDCH